MPQKPAPGGSFARGSNETNFVNSYSKRWQAGPYQNTLKGMAPNMMIDQSRGPAEFRPLSQSGVPLDGQRPVKRYGAAKFWDRIAKRYARSPVADEASYQKKLEITRGYLRPDMQVLEFGCGTGSTALIHAPHVRHIHAIDISSKMIEIAQGKADASGVKNITFDQSSFDDFDAPEQSYEVILGLSILHLLENRDAVISKVYRLLPPGGIFVSSTACLGDWMKWFKLVAPIGKFFRVLPLVKVFTSDELAASLARAGFEIEHRWQPGRGKAVFIVARKPVQVREA